MGGGVSAAAALLAELRERGVELKAAGDRLRYRPAAGVAPDDLERLRTHKAELLRLLTSAEPGADAHHIAEALPFLAMTLAEFRTRGAQLEIRMPWLSITLWFVPEERDVEALGRDGVARGRIWTAAELIALSGIRDRTPAVVKTIVRFKLGMNGDVTTQHYVPETREISRALPIQTIEPRLAQTLPAPAGRRPSRR